MKTCHVCGERFEDAYLFCWEDGTRLQPGASHSATGMPVEKQATSNKEYPSTLRAMYCQACEREYPVTFTFCPIDFLPLTQAKAIRPAPSPPSTVEESLRRPNTAVSQQYDDIDPKTELELNATEFKENEAPATPQVTDGSKVPRARDVGSSKQAAGPLQRRSDPLDLGGQRERVGTPLSTESSTEPYRHASDSHMRLAARATAIALGLFGLAALYVFYSQAMRGPDRSPQLIGSNAPETSPVEQPLIPTPPEARDYREEPGAAELNEVAEDANSRESDSRRIVGRTAPRGSSQPVLLPSTAERRYARSSDTDSASLTSGRFGSELLRVRSRRSPAGYRYELTFLLREHAGRPMRWERLSIFTRAASGSTHSESLPFPYLLAGAGTLTFTINVEMPGGSDTDWRGRISCTSVGADEGGRPLRASFAANVSP